jgi:hypothetical protein
VKAFLDRLYNVEATSRSITKTGGFKASDKLELVDGSIADLRMLRFAGVSRVRCLAVVHIYFLIGFANRFFVMLQRVLTFLTKRRQVRVFPGQERTAEAP